MIVRLLELLNVETGRDRSRVRNMLTYAGGGSARVESLDQSPQFGLRVVFEDHGPGITDPDAALADGFTTGEGLGLGAAAWSASTAPSATARHASRNSATPGRRGA